MFKELFEGKKGSVNGLQWKIEAYFEKKGYEVGVLINYFNDNDIKVQVYETDSESDIILEYRMPFNNQTPSQVYKETIKRLENK